MVSQLESGIDPNHSSGIEKFEATLWRTMTRYHVGRATQDALVPEIMRLAKIYLGIDVPRPGGGHNTRKYAGGNLRHYFCEPDHMQVSRCGRIPRARLQDHRIFEDWDKFSADVLACQHCLRHAEADRASLTDA